ncbi:MAG: acyl-CoA/acyl-ACP dehydrogenase, partial [Candidatus Eremiobacteraeota bacterium]|nr:acyl-CoA/acyl-ACP dehydrogenase [Candidatus Eremiobacteraeota bacterium]
MDREKLRADVRALCERLGGAAYWRELDAKREYPEAFARAFADARYLAALIPPEFGGLGLGLGDASVIVEEINHAGGNAGTAHAQLYTMGTVLRWGSDAQKRDWLPRIASGEVRLQAFGVTEPVAGSDTTRIETSAVRRGDVYVVNGRKRWTSRYQHSDAMLLLARTAPAPAGDRGGGLSVFLVD